MVGVEYNLPEQFDIYLSVHIGIRLRNSSFKCSVHYEKKKFHHFSTCEHDEMYVDTILYLSKQNFISV